MAMATSSATNCEVCESENETILAVAICHPCREFYCSSCVRKHQRFRATKDHLHVFFRDKSETKLTENWACEICDTPNAVNICEICKQLYCKQCSNMHRKIAATKSHTLVQIECLETSSTVDSDSELASDFEGILRNEETTNFQAAQTPISKENQGKESTPKQMVPENVPNTSDAGYRKPIHVLQDANKFSIKRDTDVKKIYVTDIATTPDGKIVIIDHGNDCLKVFHSDFRFLFKVDKIGNSFGVVSIKGDEIAVTSGNEVHFYDLSRTGDKKLNKTFNVKGSSRTICIHQKTIGVVYSSKGQGIQIFDEFGNTISDNVVTEVANESVTVSSSMTFDKSGRNYFVKVTRPHKDSWIVCYTLHGDYLWHVCVQGGIMAVAYIDNTLLVFCGHDYVVRVSQDGSSTQKIAQTQTYANRLHYDERLRQIFYCNSIDYHHIRIINYPKGGI